MNLFRSRILPAFAIALAAFAMHGTAYNASAGSIVYFSTTGANGSWTAQTVGVGGTFAFSNGGTAMSGSINTSTSPGQAQLLSGSLTINAPANAQFYLIFASSGYTSPVAPPALAVLTSVSASQLTTSTSGNVSTWVLNGDQTGIVAGTPDILTNPNLILPNPMNQGLGTVGNGTNANGAIAAVSSGYTIGQYLAVNVGGTGGNVNLSITTTVQAPEPTTMTLLGVGLVGMAGYGWRKRRLQLTQTVS